MTTPPTTPEFPFTARALALEARENSTWRDPDRQSRWWWVRCRALRRHDKACQALTAFVHQHREALIDEAITRTESTSDHGSFWWRRPDPGAILADLKAHQLCPVGLSTDQIMNRLYADHPTTASDSDLHVLENQFAAWDETTQQQAISLMEEGSYLTYSERDSAWVEGPRDRRMRDFLASEAALLPRPVTVWRGERPSARDPRFAADTWAVRPGKHLYRSARPLAASALPSAAARAEFCGIPPQEPQDLNRGDNDGWVLKITTDRAFYVGDRERHLGSPDGNARLEREVLIYAPQLLVTDMYEARIHVGVDKRVLVIECTVV